MKRLILPSVLAAACVATWLFLRSEQMILMLPLWFQAQIWPARPTLMVALPAILALTLAGAYSRYLD